MNTGWIKIKTQDKLTRYLISEEHNKRNSTIMKKISKRIEKYDLPAAWQNECFELYEKLISGRESPVGYSTKLIDSILLLLCKRKRFIEPTQLLKATRGGKGRSASKSFHFFRVLELLDGYKPPTVTEYMKSFFLANPEYAFLHKMMLVYYI